MVYCIQAQIVRVEKSGSTSHGLPTFFLDSNIQGITSAKHAEEIAKKMLELHPSIEAHVYAQEWDQAVIVRPLYE